MTLNKSTLIRRGIMIWLLLFPMAIANGILREYVITPMIGAQAGHVLSTLIFVAVVFAAAFVLMAGGKGIVGRREAVFIGVMWVALTILFEFVFGHYVIGHPWEKLLGEYNLAAGRVWVFVLVAELVAPILFVGAAERREILPNQSCNG